MGKQAKSASELAQLGRNELGVYVAAKGFDLADDQKS